MIDRENGGWVRPRVGVGVVVLRRGAVLIVRRGKPPGEGEWSLPGGSQELGETLFEAAAREVLEETGVTVAPTRVLAAVDNIVRDDAGAIEFHYAIIDVLADWRSGDPAPLDDVSEARWAPIEDAVRMIRFPAARAVIRAAANVVVTAPDDRPQD